MAETFIDVVLETLDQLKAKQDAKIAALERQIAELRSELAISKAKPAVRFCGAWDSTKAYEKNDVCVHDGSLFWAVAESIAARPGSPDVKSRAWVLCTKRGKDGRDGKDAV